LRVTGFEALVRWHHPSRGVVSPVDFIGLAEVTGLIVPIGARVLREACCQGARWRAAHPHLDLTMAVNLSACQLADPELLTTLRTALREDQLDPSALILEITESTAMESLEAAAGRLEAMRAEASAQRSTTLGPATPRWAPCGGSRSTSSRSTGRSSPASTPKRRTARSSTPSGRWPKRSACRSSPRE
jgi:hypothetical protein